MRICDARSACSDCFVVAAAVVGVGLGTMAFACSGSDTDADASIAAISEEELREIVYRFENGEALGSVNTAEHSTACLSQVAQVLEPEVLRLSAAAR